MPADEEVIEKIGRVGKVGAKARVSEVPLEAPLERVPPNREKFHGLIQRSEESAKIAPMRVEETQQGLLRDLQKVNGEVSTVSRASPARVVARSEKVISLIDQVKKDLAAHEGGLDPEVRELMERRLSNIDDTLEMAMKQAGVDYVPLERRKAKDFSGPLDDFIYSLTNADHQLNSLSEEVSNIGKNNESLNIADMLALQIKVGFIQGELELFSSLLNKGLEGLKTVMNVQV